MLYFVFVSLPVMAAGTNDKVGLWFEGQVISNGLSKAIGYYEKNLTNSIGLYVLAEKESNGYYEFYAGPKWKPLEWLEIGVGVGKENVPNSTRRNFFFDANGEKFSAYGTFENGGSGRWHQVKLVYRLTNKIGVGAMDETSLGLGPRVEYHIKKNVHVWGAVLRNREEEDKDTRKTISVLAINFSF